MAAKGMHGLETGFIGQIVARENRDRACHGRAGHHRPDGAALVATANAQFHHHLAVLQVQAMLSGQLPGQRHRGRLGLWKQAVMQRNAKALFLNQNAGTVVGESVESRSYVFKRTWPVGGDGYILPAVFAAMAT